MPKLEDLLDQVDQFQVPVQGQCWVLPDPVERAHEATEFHSLWHIHVYLSPERCPQAALRPVYSQAMAKPNEGNIIAAPMAGVFC